MDGLKVERQEVAVNDVAAPRRLGAISRARAAAAGGPLGNRSFQLLSTGQFASTVGDLCYAVALPWLVLSSHGGAILLGTVLACYGVPRTVLIPIGGILADRIGPRTVMLIADASRCVLVAALAVVAGRHTASLEVLGPIAALIGAGEGIFLPASYTMIPSILEPDQFQAANAVATGLMQAGSLAGPVLGGLLVATAGPAAAFTADAASFAISALALTLIRTPIRAAKNAVPVPAEPGTPANVWSLLRRTRVFQIMLVVIVVANLAAGGTFDVALPALAHAGYGAAGYAALIASFSVGALGGTLAAARATNLRRPAVIAYCAFLAEGITISFVPYLGGLPGAAAAIAVFGACNSVGNVLIVTLLQRWAPSRLLGRVMSLVMLASMGSFPVSVVVAGVLVHHLGPSVFFPVAGIVLGITILAGLTQRTLRDFGTEPVPQDAPASRVDLV